MLNEREIESCYLGQFIPVHYHHNMLMDRNRMQNFKAAIDYAVFPGARVLELGGGTGVLSWFAAQKAEKVWCVEFNPDMVAEARRFLPMNANGHKVEVVHADAFEYLPPEPVDVVICEMIHVAMLREKQVDVIEDFKARYRQRFPHAGLPVFIPEAVIMAVQPLQQRYEFEGFHAPIIQFQETGLLATQTLELGDPVVYSLLDFSQDVGRVIRFEGQLEIKQAGTLNALRFITKNILAVVQENSSTIDWLNHYMVLPMLGEQCQPTPVEPGDLVDIVFQYRCGASLPSLQAALQVRKQYLPAQRQRAYAYA
ncbi:methyltransferase domain-containing protein [Massilia sp. W12]|uniref:methyltransferase domain-containing protein n=1 Tax=Massilia sp. W12 TaxID=3126507 RepID=UPI0030D60BFB